MKVGIVVWQEAYLYDSDFSGIVDELFMGWAVGIIEEKDEWLKVVTHYGYSGYLKRPAVRFASGEELCNRDDSQQTAFINCPFADVMESPKVQAKILFTLSRGSFVQRLLERQRGYQKVELADGSRGYVPVVALSRRLDSDGYLYTDNPKDYFLRQKRIREFPENVIREKVAAYAKSYLGTQYRWGAKSSSGLDCSGLTFMSYQMSGILIYRDAVLKSEYPVREIPLYRAKKGDLLYFPGHIAIYLGNRHYIHATGNENSFRCMINSLSETDSNYREDLAKSIYAAGSVFATIQTSSSHFGKL